MLSAGTIGVIGIIAWAFHWLPHPGRVRYNVLFSVFCHRSFIMPSQHPARTEPTLRYLLCTNPGGWHRMGYWEWGDERNEDVLLCMHGLTRNGRDFDAVARRFSHKYRVICPDMAGRGTSDWLENPDFYTFAQYVGDLASLIARLQPARITWLGTSMGGLIGLTFIYMLSQTAKTPLGGGRCNAAAQDWLIQKANPVDRLILNDIGPELALEGMKNIARYVEAGQSFATHDEALAYARTDRKSTRLNSSHVAISYAVLFLKKKQQELTLMTLPS